MKKILNLSIILAALAFASSCQDEAGLNPPEPQTVTIKAGAGLTKTLLDGGAVKWENGDKISLVFTHDTESPAVETFSTSIDGKATASADFTGKLPLEVYREGSGYHEDVFAVYPYDAANAEGELDFTLPAEQRIRPDGTFASGLNLTSAVVSLEDIRDNGKASATFMNALSIIRFSVKSDVKSVTLTGTSPLAGMAPLNFDASGRLVVDADGEWTGAYNTVTVLPAEDNECFAEGEVNLLVWPGTHSKMSVTVNFAEFGEFHKSKTFDSEFEFKPAKYYTLNLNADSETIVSELVGEIGGIEDELDDLEGRLAALETTAQKVSLLLDQIQSVSLMTEYLDNAVYAPYARMLKDGGVVSYAMADISLDYIIRPAKAAELLLQVCEESGTLSEVLSAKVDMGGSISNLKVKEASLDGDVMTVKVDASAMATSFYANSEDAALVLEISDGNTEILSDFANLVPKPSVVLSLTKSTDIPVMRDAEISIPYTYGVAADEYNVSISAVRGFPDARKPRLTNTEASQSGHINATFTATDDLSQMEIDLTITAGDETSTETLTFVDGGDFEVKYQHEVERVGGDIYLTPVTPNNYGTVTMMLENSGWNVPYRIPDIQTPYNYWYDWIKEMNEGVQGVYTVKPNEVITSFVEDDPQNPGNKITITLPEGQYVNSGAERNATIKVTVDTDDPIENGAITYTRYLPIRQKNSTSPVDESKYYANGDKVQLQKATAAGITPLNIVIVGDGFILKDLMPNGKFESRARSACDAFFDAEPFRSFRDRFNVYMLAYKSNQEGVSVDADNDITTPYDVDVDTYFKTYVKDMNDTWVTVRDQKNKTDQVLADAGLSAPADYYRTIVIILVNTEANVGSNLHVEERSGSEAGEDYVSMTLAILTANSTGTKELVRHEAGGHAFGRLADEYQDKEYTGLQGHHSLGWYRNVTSNQSEWNWNHFSGLAGYESVGYYQPSGSNFWAPSQLSGIMYNNKGEFNAPCRQIIYERIIKQTEGYNAYSWEKFLEYDKRNINKD